MRPSLNPMTIRSNDRMVFLRVDLSDQLPAPEIPGAGTFLFPTRNILLSISGFYD
jgi:hypothetical protein